ncbi:MAG UNVERIFIED_CONTAM: hypothetical protein LVT10_25750 [Anaerolineae bacterium]|jgi:hypothetical protein
MLPLSIVAVAWTGVAVVIGETASTPVQYAIASAVFVVIALIAGSLVLRRESNETPVRSLANDPMVTGERTGIAHIWRFWVGYWRFPITCLTRVSLV